MDKMKLENIWDKLDKEIDDDSKYFYCYLKAGQMQEQCILKLNKLMNQNLHKSLKMSLALQFKRSSGNITMKKLNF